MLTRPSSVPSVPCVPSGMWNYTLPPQPCSSPHDSFCSESLDFKTLDDAISRFNGVLRMHPPPSTDDFAQLLTSITEMKHYSVVISLSPRMDSFGIPPNVETLNILINFFCHLKWVNFSFSVLAKILKHGHQPNTATFNRLIRGLYAEGKIDEAIHSFDKMGWEGFQPDEVTYETLMEWLYKKGPKWALFSMSRTVLKGENRGFNLVAFSTIIYSLWNDTQLTKALNFLHEIIITKGISPT